LLFTKIDIGLANDVFVYGIDPTIEAQFISNTNQYFSFIDEDANRFEFVQLINQNNNYLSKDAVKNSSVTEIAKKDFEYTIQEGESVSGIADKFGLHVATLVDKNNLSVNDIENIKPGQKLVIPIKDSSDSKDWLVQLNDKKEEERQLALAEEKARQAQLAKTLYTSTRNSVVRDTSSARSTVISSDTGSKSNGYPYGYCTYYVAARRAVPSSWGNAGQWLGNAAASGYATGDMPSPGAIMVSNESWWGHVAIVESVNGNSFTVSEMNYAGWGVTSTRTISVNNGVVEGFIY
jgi:surface antigen